MISEDGAGSAMFSEITEKNSSATRGDMASADYTFNAKTNTWESVQKAPNSDLTGHMYANGTSSRKGIVAQVIEKGMPEEIDAVSRATCSSNAILEGCKKALEEAERQAETEAE